MRAFVVRPFGEKSGIDFERVHRELIAPALKRLSIEGDTTQDIARAGNIRADMFKLLAVADLVVADLSIHNANVFYELGVRHAIRERRTFLIRAKVDAVPFDLQTDRYLQYDKDAPGASVDALVRGLRDTLDSEEVDSPVMTLMREELIPPDFTRLLAPPSDFHEEVRRAAQERRTGDLALLAEEVPRLLWAREGLRRVGTAQFELASWEPARLTWEKVRGYEPDDVEANSRLATIHQKLGDLTRSDEAIDRVLKNPEVRGPERAELQALRGSNHKARWGAEWTEVDDDVARGRAALESPWLKRSYDAYWDAFSADRNHFYSGLNALAVGTILIELGRRLPDAWAAGYDSDEQATAALTTLTTQRTQLQAAVDLARQSAQRSAEFLGRPDKWLEISMADFGVLTGLAPARVAGRYRTALAGAQPFHFSAARRQLEIFSRLGVFPEGAAAGLAVVDELALARSDPGASSDPARVILFTGHRMDAPGRKQARFPAGAEGRARTWIADAVKRERDKVGGEVVGIAGGASGADILFHEVCAELGIKTQLFIVASREAYIAASVQDGGPGWVERFDALYGKLPRRVLGDSQQSVDLPRWLRAAKHYSIWERNNRWMLNNALAYGPIKVSLIALWNGEAGDGPGGTKDMVETARERGARVEILDARPLAAMAPEPQGS